MYHISSYKAQGYLFFHSVLNFGYYWKLLNFTYINVQGAGIIRNVDIIRGRALYEEIRLVTVGIKGQLNSKCLFVIFSSPKKRTTLLLLYLKSNWFRSVFKNWRHKKEILKLTESLPKFWIFCYKILLVYTGCGLSLGGGLSCNWVYHLGPA